MVALVALDEVRALLRLLDERRNVLVHQTLLESGQVAEPVNLSHAILAQAHRWTVGGGTKSSNSGVDDRFGEPKQTTARQRKRERAGNKSTEKRTSNKGTGHGAPLSTTFDCTWGDKPSHASTKALRVNLSNFFLESNFDFDFDFDFEVGVRPDPPAANRNRNGQEGLNCPRQSLKR